MESIWYAVSFFAVVAACAAVIWQALHYSGYERVRSSECQERLDEAYERISELSAELKTLQLLFMSYGKVSYNVGRDFVGGDVAKRDDTRAGGDVNQTDVNASDIDQLRTGKGGRQRKK